MRGSLVLLLFSFLVTLSFCSERRSFDTFLYRDSDTMSVRYSNTWALKVSGGGPNRADDLAAQYGLINKGQIGSLKDMYLFELPGGPLEEMPEITKLLLKEENVYYVEQQKYSHNVLKQK